MAEELRHLGAETEEKEDELIVRGGESNLEGAVVDGRGDHRIVMALSVAALACSGPTMVSDAEHVDVSFPNFFDVLYDLGASVSR
jgi:3-phosphoshikimate 1-carboxyvinyltransferase